MAISVTCKCGNSLDKVFARLNEKPGDVKAKVAACLAEPTCLPAVAVLKTPHALDDIEKRLGRYQGKQDQSMLFPAAEGTRQARPIFWYRYGRLDVGTELNKPVVVAVRVWAADF